MRKLSRILFVGFTAALVLAAAVTIASATRLGVNTTDFRAIYPDLRFNTSAGSAECQITLLASFHSRTISKVSRALGGAITSATWGACDSGTMTILTETLPWHIQYNGFTGFLPNPTGVRVMMIGTAYRISIEGIACLARTDAAEPGGGTAALSGGTVTRLDADSSFVIDVDDSGFFCSLAGDATFSGSANVTTAAGGTARIRLL